MSRSIYLSLIAKVLLVFVSVLGLVACSKPKEGIEVTDAWVRDMPPGATSTAAFMTIKNHTGKPVVLTGVEMPGAGHVMMHETKVVNDMAKMVHLENVTIDKEVRFEPGAKHIMVMGLDMSQKVESYNISLHFANNPTLEVSAEVRNANQ